MTEVKPKAKSRKSADWEEALSTYKSEIEERKDLVHKLSHYRDGCSDAEWVIIHKAIQVMKVRIAKMGINHDQMTKSNER